MEIVKAKGRLKVLAEKTNDGKALVGTCGIGHTRWATHGAPDDVNAHPHKGGNGRITLVHNGIIENYIELKIMLEQKGYKFVSQTDTEVLAHLFDFFYNGDSLKAMSNVMKTVRGSYAVAVLIDGKHDEIIAARKDSPLIVGLGENENFLASDIPAVLKYTRDCYLLDDNQMALLKQSSVKLYDIDGNEVHKDVYHVTWDVEAAEKGGFDHFMKKEISEQPKTVHDTVTPRIKDGKVVIDELGLSDEDIKNIGTIHIVACGSAWHVGTAARYIIEKLARIPCEVDLASEFRYRNPIIKENDICLVISQSGETADTLAALREAKSKGARTISIVNVIASTIARESDDVIYTMAGPEIAVHVDFAILNFQQDPTALVQTAAVAGEEVFHGLRLHNAESVGGQNQLIPCYGVQILAHADLSGGNLPGIAAPVYINRKFPARVTPGIGQMLVSCGLEGDGALSKPAIFLLVQVNKADRLDKEPAGLLISLIIQGIISTALAVITERLGTALLDSLWDESSLAYRLCMYFIVVGLSEEGFKYLLLKRRTWYSPDFNCQFDGVVYAVCVALGFALWENIGYVVMYGFGTALGR